MQYRIFGRTGIKVSEIRFGTWAMGGDWGPTDDKGALDALVRAFDLGVTFYDTALAYGNGHSETLIRDALAKHRDRIVIATKVPPKNHKWPAVDRDPVKKVFPASWVVACTERSLKNLGTDHVDFQQLHVWAAPWIEQLEWYDALEKLKAQGKVRAFGVSVNDWDPYNGVDLVQSDLIDSVQVIYNIFEQRPAERMLPAALEHKVGIIARVPFEEGLLTGKLVPGCQFKEGDWRAEWLTPDRLAEVARRVERLKEFLASDRPTVAALALKFCLSHPAVSTAIPGMRTIANVEANVAASDGKLLAPDELEALKEHAFVHGWGYPWTQK
jgi:aryl-alcohol dehydrogenase-like predicted oxidoreductase